MNAKICGKSIKSRSKFTVDGLSLQCAQLEGHEGKCDEFPYLGHLKVVAPKVANKIKRDAIMTTGASWKSEDAGPNRILRWVMLRSDQELLAHGINMADLKPQVVAKLRDKAASYEDCMGVARKLTATVYEMPGAPEPTPEIKSYLESVVGPIKPGAAVCVICKEPLSFDLFAAAKRGKAEIESAHGDPRRHTAANVGFAHRACNIAQGDKPLEEFYDWIEDILKRVRPD